MQILNRPAAVSSKIVFRTNPIATVHLMNGKAVRKMEQVRRPADTGLFSNLSGNRGEDVKKLHTISFPYTII